MLKHLPAVIFFLCLTTVIINVSLYERMDIFIAAVVVGSLAMVGQHLMERQQKKAKTPDHDTQLAYWRNQLTHVTAALAEARSQKDDRVPFLESQLAEAERTLKKLGAAEKKR